MSENSDDYGEDDDLDDYYNNNDDFLYEDEDDSNAQEIGLSSSNNHIKKRIQALEHYNYKCLTESETKQFLLDRTKEAGSMLDMSPSSSRLVLQSNKWKIAAISARAKVPSERKKMLIDSGTPMSSLSKVAKRRFPSESRQPCDVCFENVHSADLSSLSCNHMFCRGCWKAHVEFCVNDGLSSGVPCMESNCSLLCDEEFLKPFLSKKMIRGHTSLSELYQKYLFEKSVTAHFQLRFCPGVDCSHVFYAETPKPRCVQCSGCKTSCCFDCGSPYHIPTDCETIRKWLTKCADDSETANYISANTKDCPQCHICIEKNGGCNHIKCSKCRHDFCWMCLGDWKKHGDSYYECSRYKENQEKSSENKQTHAREALKKYLFYFHRWQNHSQSLRLEAQARKKILEQIEEKVNSNEGTWIDWQYLLQAGELLAQCRRTLYYTYPLAYYAEAGAQKELFEYQQAQLEVEIEGLAWKLENIKDYQRGDIENQMDVCEKRTYTLLARFVEN